MLRLRPPNGFGDHLMLSAVIEGLKAERPELRIHLAATHPEIFQHNPHVEWTAYEGRMKKWRRAELERYHRVHFRSPQERYLQLSGHLIDDMYREVGVELRERPRQPRIYLTERELQFRAEQIEALPRPRIAIVPFGKGTVRLPNKVYPAAQWCALTQLLGGIGGALLHLGASQEGPRAEGAVDFRDIGYRNTASVLQRCDLVVTHVSGIMHLAAAVGTPAVVLYGAAEHPAISGYPWNRNVYVPIECGPCWMETPCSHHSCMKQLTPERALSEVREALGSAGKLTTETRRHGEDG
ncbi:MAG: glycosyltransferase family 9 protein [Actinomycetota bacterium]